MLYNRAIEGKSMNEEIKLLKEKVKHLKVLYVEDEDDMRIGTELFLKKFFTFVQTAKDGEEGLEKFKSNDFEIIFTDILMPKMNGLEMLDEVGKINDDIFAAALSASEIYDREIKENTDMHFRKPITYENMFVILKNIVEKFNL